MEATVMVVRCMFCDEVMDVIDGQGIEGDSHGAHPACIEREWGIDMSDVPEVEPCAAS